MPENTIPIKMEKIKDLNDLYNSAHAFQTIFSQLIINDTINGKTEIVIIENGSICIDIYVGSLQAVTLIGSVAWASAVLYKKIQEGKVMFEQVKSLEIKNESLKDIQMAQKEQLSQMLEIEARNIQINHFSNQDNSEQFERIKLSISLLSEQLEKGSKIHPQLNAPEDVKNLFPNMGNLIGVESKIKQLKE